MPSGSTTTLSNVDIIKLFVYENEPVTEDQVVAHIREVLELQGDDEEIFATYVEPVLKNYDYFTGRTSTKGGKKQKLWRINKQKLPEHQVVMEVIDELRRFVTERNLKRAVAKKLGIKYSQVALDPAKVEGLRRHKGRWGREEWIDINPQAYQVLKEAGRPLNEKEIVRRVLEKHPELDKGLVIFTPEMDSRFTRVRKLWDLTERLQAAEEAKQEKARIAGFDITPKKGVSPTLEQEFAQAFIEGTREQQARKGKGKAKKETESPLKMKLKKKVKERLEKEGEGEQAASDRRAVLGLEREELRGKNFNRIETLPRERHLNKHQRLEVINFLTELASMGSEEKVTVHGPLSVRKVEDLLYHNYQNYTQYRIPIPRDYCRYLAQLAAPSINQLVINPAAGDGLVAVSLVSYVYDSLENARWALGDDGLIEVLTDQGEIILVDATDAPLLEKAKESFFLSQYDFVDHFLTYNFVSLETDPVLAKATQIVALLSGFPKLFVAQLDFFSQLDRIFGEEVTDLKFDLIVGNFAFKGDANLVANYIDHALNNITPQGRVACFVTDEFLEQVKGHEFFREMTSRANIHCLIKLPPFGNARGVSILVLDGKERASGEKAFFARPTDIETLNQVVREVVSGKEEVRGASQLRPKELMEVMA